MIEAGDFILIIIILVLLIISGVAIGFIIGLMTNGRHKH